MHLFLPQIESWQERKRETTTSTDEEGLIKELDDIIIKLHIQSTLYDTFHTGIFGEVISESKDQEEEEESKHQENGGIIIK